MHLKKYRLKLYKYFDDAKNINKITKPIKMTIKNEKNDELEEKLIEELEGDYDESGGNRKLLIIGGVVAGVLIVIAIILSLVAGKNSQTETEKTAQGDDTATEQDVSQKPQIAYNDDFSRDPNSTTAQKVGEPNSGYPTKTSGARVPVDQSGKSVEDGPIQKSLMIDDRENPFHALHTIAPDISNLMEINLYNVQNKALALGELTDKARIQMPSSLFNHLDNFYRIFMYRGQDEKGPGTAIIFSTGMDKSQLETSLREWEKTMVNDLRSFVLIGLKKDFVAASSQKTFQNSSIYRGARYIDFSDSGVVSLNYVTVDKYIVIANSRTSFEKALNILQK